MDEKNVCKTNELNVEGNQEEQVKGYNEKISVSKNSSSTVTSGSTGSLAGYAYYSASCTSGTLTATVQYYNNTTQTYENTLATRKITSGQSFSNESAHVGGARLFRLVLSGSTGRGSGSIQGYD